MSRRHLLYYYQSLLEHLIGEPSALLYLLEDWCKYNNVNLDLAIDLILEHSDELTDEFFDRFIEILDKYGKTEFALLCVRKLIEDCRKERFEL